MLVGLAEERIFDEGKDFESIPEPLKECPDLDDNLVFYYRAFYELATCRSIGFSLGPIPWTSIQAYANEYGLVEYERELLFYSVREMDKLVMEDYVSRQKRNQDS